jgi:hypothetical protein
VGFVGGETGYCSETCVTGDVGETGEGSVDGEWNIDIKEEVSIKVEEAVDVKDETPEALVNPIKTEPEVRFWGVCEVVTAVVCEVVTAHSFRPFIALKPKGNCEITFNWYPLCIMLWGS